MYLDAFRRCKTLTKTKPMNLEVTLKKANTGW